MKPATNGDAGISKPVKSVGQTVPKTPKVKSNAGRPTELYQSVLDKIVEDVADGNYREVAAKLAGIPIRTLASWMARGKKETTGIFAELLHAVVEAESAAEIKEVKRVVAAGAEDPRHAKWWLKRKFPDRWAGNRQELNCLRRELNALIAQLGANYRGVAPTPPPKTEGREELPPADTGPPVGGG